LIWNGISLDVEDSRRIKTWIFPRSLLATHASSGTLFGVEQGEVLGRRFRLEARVNGGGMGEVFRARDIETGAIVAAKMLIDISPENVERFEREAHVLRCLSHPGIVRCIAYDASDSDAPILAMEWLDGEDLGELLARRPLSVEETIALGTRIADALGAAHNNGVVHRDLKPQNIFLEHSSIETPKILDFGIAHCNGQARITQTGTVIGTPSYMAPEQARSSSEVDTAADVFSLGCVLFECLTGTPPFHAEHMIAVLAKIMFEDAPRVSSRLPNVPAWLDSLVARMLAKEPAMRPPHGAAVVTALGARNDLHSTRGGTAGPTTLRPSLGCEERRFLGVVLRGRDVACARRQGPDVTVASNPAAELAAVAARFGGFLETFADGTSAIIIDKGLVPTDVAARVARCALGVWALSPGTPMAVAVGFGERAKGLPMGEAIDRAARLLHASGDSKARVALDETAAELLDARFDVVFAGDGSISLVGERSPSESFRTLRRKTTPMVGRAHELAQLELTFEACVSEPTARAVIVSGSAGIGKSRLIQEFAERRLHKTEIWSCRGDPLRAATSFGMLAEALRSAARIKGGESLGRRQTLLSARVAECVPEGDQRRVVSFLGELAGIPLPDDDDLPLRAARRDPDLCGEQMQRALREFLRAECSRGPVVLLLEDVQWSDRASLLALDAVLEDLAFEPLFVLAAARPEIDEVFPALWARRGRLDIRLRSLSPKACAELAHLALGNGANTTTIERLVAWSEGHPFFLEELLREAAEGRIGSPPGTVVAMVQSRLECLEPNARKVLRAASILGGTFWSGAVSRLSGDDDDTVARALAVLAAHGICARQLEGRFPGVQQWTFRQALFREGAHAQLTGDDRSLGHRLAGEWLEEKGGVDPLVLAEHFERGGLASRAAALCLTGAEQAAARRDYPVADQCYGRAELLLGQLPMSARRARGLSRFRMGQYPEALADLGAAREEARMHGDALAETELLLDEAMVLDWMGDYREAEARVSTASAVDVGIGAKDAAGDPQPQMFKLGIRPPLVEARLLLGVGRSLHRAEQQEAAAAMLLRAAEQAASLGDEGYETHMIALLLLGYISPFLGRFSEATRALDDVIRHCEERSDFLHLGAARNNRAIVRAHCNDRKGMMDDFESTIALGCELGQPTLELAGHYNLAEHLYWLHDAELARVHVREAFATAARRSGCTRPPALALLDARIALSNGAHDAARDIAFALRAAGEPLSPSEDVLCTMIELATENVEDDALDDAWNAVVTRSARESVGQERIEVLEARALFAARCGRIAEARFRLAEAIELASQIPNVMGERLHCRVVELERQGSPGRLVSNCCASEVVGCPRRLIPAC